MSTIRVISDVHGKIKSYIKLAKDPSIDYSIQLGDMGFDYEHMKELSHINHYFASGNHDNYDILLNSKTRPKHWLGNFGNVKTAAGHEFFFVRGAPSIDAMIRVQEFIINGQKSWWYEEELTFKQFNECRKLYTEVNPDVVLSHDCPQFLGKQFSNQEMLRRMGWGGIKLEHFRTPFYLQRLWENHKPKLWCFGHWHRHFDEVIEGCRFICLPELEYIDFDENWNLKE